MNKLQNRFQIKMTYEMGLEKARHFAAYQERCILEMDKKLRAWGVEATHREAIIDQLVEEDMINEQRFAIAYVRGKFRMKKWGRMKIKRQMQQKQIPESCINLGLDNIKEAEYKQQLIDLLEAKISKEGQEISIASRNRILWNLVSKGYESELILQEMRKLIPLV